MFSIVKSVIESRNYELSDMLKKLDTLWVQGSITDAEREELIALARENANANKSIDLFAMLEELDERVRVLEEKCNTENSTETSTSEPNEPKPSAPKLHAPEYKTNKNYKNGERVTFEGKIYICVVPNKEKCVWSPSEYPEYWSEYVED